MDKKRGITLNAYVAQCGICSRRAAVEIIACGHIRVNGRKVMQPYYRVFPGDHVVYQNKLLQKPSLLFLLLNKPRGCLTTMHDPKRRHTVLDLIVGATDKRIYPVGRLDRDTTGLLLFTNDGDLALKLAHPRYVISKIYHATLAVPLLPWQYQKLQRGVYLRDGFIKPDSIEPIEHNYARISLRIHSGANRVVRRMFSNVGATVRLLDRVEYACLKKGSLVQGCWRWLDHHEIKKLKQTVELRD